MEDSDIETCIAREFRTPYTEAARAVFTACDVFAEAVGTSLKDGTNPRDFFIGTIFKEKWDDSETDGDRAVQIYFDDIDKDPEEASKLALLQLSLITISYAVQAMKAEKDSRQAWSFAVSATYWAGLIRGKPFGSATISDAALKLAKMRHAENYALADDALKYWRENIDPHLSAAKAANDLVRVVPLSHKKLAEIISAAKKDIGKT